MNTKDTIYKRRSVRDYQDKAVDKATIEELINAAVQAPSATNTQPCTFGVIQSSEMLLEISNNAKKCLVSVLEKAPALEKYRVALESPDFNIFYNATSLVIICAKPEQSLDPTVDCTLAAENLMLMARDLGLGTCWIGFAAAYLNIPEVKRKLGIDETYKIVAPIIVGYPASEISTMEKNPANILFWK